MTNMARLWVNGILAFAVLATGAAMNPPAARAADNGLPAIDPQKVQDQDTMTWDDYKPIPGKDWADPSLVPTKKQFKVALIAVDFDDQPFVITQPKKSDLFGNPQIDPVKREDVPQFYANFYNKPSAINHGHTINGYWMEQSKGQIGIGKIDAFGPYRMPNKLFQYGLNEFGQAGGLPTGFTVSRNDLSTDAATAWRKDKGQNISSNYDIVIRIYAGYDETGVWQEFGEMKFQTKNDIPPEWGNPDPTKPRWVRNRYTDWTSWKAGQMQWGNSAVRQGENSGTLTHEITHFAFQTGDNNNNPYIEPYRRVGSGPWDVMDRGSFNGPGGPHNRWEVPATDGASMPAGFMLRQRMRFEFVKPEQVLRLNRDGLAKTGIAVGTVSARAVEPLPGELAGMVVWLDGPEIPLTPPPGMAVGGGRGFGRGGVPTTTQDRTPWDDPTKNPLSPGVPTYNFYTMEVVQRIGYDSYCPDSGVLIAKNKQNEGSTLGPNGFNCFNWVIDAHPEDIKMVDFKRPNGEPVMRTVADYRQLNDALFHAGVNSGSQYEWEDTPNRLHFYVIDVKHDAQGIESYTMGVRSLDGSGPQKRDVKLAPPAAVGPAGAGELAAFEKCEFTLTNSGEAAQTDPKIHFQDANPWLTSDIYRLSVSVDGAGWTAGLQNALAAVKFGENEKIPVFLKKSPGAGAATVHLTAVSEGDTTRKVTVDYTVK